MTSSQDISPQQGATVLETATVLSGVLQSADYSRDVVNNLAVNIFLENERANIKAPATMHLLGLKKALLHAIPVIAPPSSNAGITLTSQVASRAIQYDTKRNKAKAAALAVGDKYRLVGLAFPAKLFNHLAYNIFPWKYFNALPSTYHPLPIDLSYLSEIETKHTPLGSVYLIKPAHYEDANLFNSINRVIAYRLNETMSIVLALSPTPILARLPEIARATPAANLIFIDQINQTLIQQIDQTYSMALYEALWLSANWLLYDQIELLGFTSVEVSKQLAALKYVKKQKLQMQANTRETTYRLLLNTHTEKITREQYPYYFDYTDRRAIFVRFNQFSISKLPKKEQANVKLLLEKDLAAQHAILHNQCEHLQHLKAMRVEGASSLEASAAVVPCINYEQPDGDQMYLCRLCAYPIMCIHEVELYDALRVKKTKGNGDQEYWVRQKIINKYKLINQRRTGEEDTEVSFTYYCKHCGGDLGKTNDAIQASIKTSEVSVMVNEDDPYESYIMITILSVLSSNLNQAIMPMRKKPLSKLIFSEAKPEIMRIVNAATKSERANIDILTRYLVMVYTLASLISINMHKLKSSESILLVGKSAQLSNDRQAASGAGTAQVKTELLTALKIVKTNKSLKQIGVTDEKIKAMLIEAFKSMNLVFAEESIQLSVSTPRERLALDVATSPLVAYASYMYRRNHKWKHAEDVQALTGIDLDQIYPKKRSAPKLSTHALYTNIFRSKATTVTPTDQYIEESYQSIVNFVTQEPTKGRYLSVVTPPISEAARKYETELTKRIRANRTTPLRFLPVENSLEYDFDLKVYQIAYCLTDPPRPHRWVMAKAKAKLTYTCQYCDLNIDKAARSNNEQIDSNLENQMLLAAFFEFYTLSCPVKDAHVFVNDQCGTTKAQLAARDPKYYKKHLAKYNKYRRSITTTLLEDAAGIVKHVKPVAARDKRVETKADMLKLESLASSISKLFNVTELHAFGMVADARSLDMTRSYARLFYSYYTFGKNASADMHSHPDPEFFAFIKKYYLDVKAPNLPALPPFPEASNPDQLLTNLFQNIYDLIDKGDADINHLVEFIIHKIVKQNSTHQDFNFAKLKAINTLRKEAVVAQDADTDAEEVDMFDGYDIEADDAEYNMDSFKD